MTYRFVECSYLIKKIIGFDFYLASLYIIDWTTVIMFHYFLIVFANVQLDMVCHRHLSFFRDVSFCCNVPCSIPTTDCSFCDV